MVAVVVAPSPGSYPAPLQGAPVERIPLLAEHLASGRPMEGDGKAARGKAAVAHVGCCVFWVVNRYVYQNAQTEI